MNKHLFPAKYCLTLALIACGFATGPAAATMHAIQPADPSATYYVATTGSDLSGNGSLGLPWASITHALNSVPDGSTILVQPGSYYGQVRLDRQFIQGVTVRSATPYQARLRHSGSRVVVAFYGQHITMQGFDIAHNPDNTAALVIQIQDLLGAPGVGDGSDPVVSYITLRDNIIHDSTNNDLLKINNGARHILVEGNMFFNQNGSDEHIDVNSVVDVIVQDNIFFNQFQDNPNDTSSFIVIKDSNGADDGQIGAENIVVRRNIFLNWQGNDGANFILLGEDGKPYHEAFDILVENNLMLGNASNMMRAAFGVKGGRDITFRNNTVVGDLPSRAFAMRLNTEGANPINQNIYFYNNAWSDPNGSMGAEGYSGVDFAEVSPTQNSGVVLGNNLYWNAANPIPADPTQLIHFSDDAARIIADPLLGSHSGLVVPHWNGSVFVDGSNSIRQAFERLIDLYGKPASSSPLIDSADMTHTAADDILGRLRGADFDVGAYETNPVALMDIFLPIVLRNP